MDNDLFECELCETCVRRKKCFLAWGVRRQHIPNITVRDKDKLFYGDPAVSNDCPHFVFPKLRRVK